MEGSDGCLFRGVFRHLPRGNEKNHEKYHYSQCPDRNSNRAPPEYKSEPLPVPYKYLKDTLFQKQILKRSKPEDAIGDGGGIINACVIKSCTEAEYIEQQHW